MNEERGMIKWAPFASVIDPKTLVNKVDTEKNKISKPIISEEEIQNIENDIMYSLNIKEPISITYYEKGKILQTNSIVIKIDTYSKIIYFSNNLKLHFDNIIKTKKSIIYD